MVAPIPSIAYASAGISVSTAKRTGRRSNAVESTTSVSVVKTWGTAWITRSTRSRSIVSRARP